jgi:hypothetical protein
VCAFIRWWQAPGRVANCEGDGKWLSRDVYVNVEVVVGVLFIRLLFVDTVDILLHCDLNGDFYD